jgi:AraC-like DNA-binding protein
MLRARISTLYAGKETVAEALSVHPRELTRRLTTAGTSFRSLASEARFETACHLLLATDLTVSDIARTLHYADASGFIRAFTRTSRISPTEWRERSYTSLRKL